MKHEAEIQRTIVRALAITSIAMFVVSLCTLSLFHLFSTRSKSKMVVDGIRNELLLNDSRVLDQKLHTFVANDDLVSIQIKGGKEYKRKRSFFELQPLDLNFSIPILADNQDPESSVGILIFTHSLGSALKGSIVFTCLFLVFLMFFIPQIKRILRAQIQEEESRDRLQYQVELSKQVAHDIRSPLTALEVALRDTSGFTEGQRQLLEQATSRIKSIAEDLLSKSRQTKSEIQYVMPEATIIHGDAAQGSFNLSESIIRIVREKNAFVSGFEIVASGTEDELLVVGEKNAFERSLANLIQNSIEALEGVEGPSLLVAVRKYPSQIQVIVADNGKGIPEEVLSRIGEEGFSFGKESGNGLGVSSAKRKIQEWGGDLYIVSRPGSGTMITATLQLANL